MTLDFKGRFLFTASYNPSKISMFVVDPNTGALQEVLNSPFASLSTNDPVFLSTESSGQFLCVINFNGSQPNVSSVESFQIDPVNLGLIPSSSGASQLPGLFLSGATHPSGKSFYAFLNAPHASIPNEAFFLLFDSSTGKFTIPNPNMSSSAATFGCCFALDPQGKSLVLGVSNLLTLYSLQADGTLAPNPVAVSVNGEALSMAFDTFGRFLYVDFPNPPTTSTIVHIFSPVTLQETSHSPLPSNFPSSGTWIVDPPAPLIYADQDYQVNPQTGIPSSILPVSPISSPSARSSAHRGPHCPPERHISFFWQLVPRPNKQRSNIDDHQQWRSSAELEYSRDYGSKPRRLCGNGYLPRSKSFATRQFVFRPRLLHSFGSRQPDGSSNNHQQCLSHHGICSVKRYGLDSRSRGNARPGSLDFGTVTQGTSASLNISVKNSGTATLRIASVVLGGANAGDYSSSSPACNSAIAVNSACTIIVTLTPLASGVRSATVTITDDAPGSPQTPALSGTGVATGPGATFSPAAPSFPTITLGRSGTLQTLTVINSGTTPLHVSSVALGDPNPSDFSFTNNCTSPVAPAGQLYDFTLRQSNWSWATHGKFDDHRRCAGFAADYFAERHH